jgi:hypothetical protein
MTWMEVHVKNMKKKIALAAAVVSGVYLFVPEPTDVIPVLGWLDEGMALAILGWSMRTLGVTPDAFFRRRKVQDAETDLEQRLPA